MTIQLPSVLSQLVYEYAREIPQDVLEAIRWERNVEYHYVNRADILCCQNWDNNAHMTNLTRFNDHTAYQTTKEKRLWVSHSFRKQR